MYTTPPGFLETFQLHQFMIKASHILLGLLSLYLTIYTILNRALFLWSDAITLFFNQSSIFIRLRSREIILNIMPFSHGLFHTLDRDPIETNYMSKLDISATSLNSET